MLSTSDIEKKILSLTTERHMYFAPLTSENVGKNRICDVRYLGDDYEDFSYQEVLEEECKGYGMFMLDESKQMTASVVLCNNTTPELTGPYIELSMLCSKMDIKTGQGKILALLAMFYSYFLLNNNRIFLKVAKKNAEKLIPFYTSLGFTPVSHKSLVMTNNDIKTFIESYDFDKLRLKLKTQS
jgi:hypothetical protein